MELLFQDRKAIHGTEMIPILEEALKRLEA
jgi:hypothetical protein